MAGIYIHIPFCKQACHYCDFHFSTHTKLKKELVQAICLELEQRKDYLGFDTIETIYFGGGTPSLLSNQELEEILNSIHKHYRLDVKETTIELNPDDITPSKMQSLSSFGFNRLSIGIQSLDDDLLNYMNRPHDSQQAILSVQTSQNAGFNNISIDLIYGIPGLKNSEWLRTLYEIKKLSIQHISAYNLTIENGTVFGNWQRKGRLSEQDDEVVLEQIDLMNNHLISWGYERYEISNFGLKGHYSQHNSSYWTGKKYLGIGPSAHSYDHISRQWNIANNALYIKKVPTKDSYFEKELLTEKDKINELLLTGLRTIWGVELELLPTNYSIKNIDKKIKEGLLTMSDGRIFLTEKGKLFADEVALDLMI